MNFQQSPVIQESKEIQKLMKWLMLLPVFQMPAIFIILASNFMDISSAFYMAGVLLYSIPTILSPVLILSKIKRYRRRAKKILGCCFKAQQNATAPVVILVQEAQF